MAAIVGARRYTLSSGSTELVTFEVPLVMDAPLPLAVEGQSVSRVNLGFDVAQHEANLAAELRRLADRVDPRT